MPPIDAMLPNAVGAPIKFDEIAHLKDRQTMVDELRARTDGLKAKLPALDPNRRRL